MKTLYFSIALLLAASIAAPPASSQALLPNQNPNYAVSRDKYMRLADSLTRLHSTTLQDTYAAPDWYEQKMQRREDRREFRRELRMERARHYSNYPYNYGYPYYNYDRYRYNRHYNPLWFWRY